MTTELQSARQPTEKDVFERLEHLERTVYVPSVSGEVPQWLDAVSKAIHEAADTTCDYYRLVHTDLFKQMTELDPEQNARVQMLDQADDEICAGLHALGEFAEKLRGAGDLVEPDERLISGATQELAQRAVALVLRIRKHETEISTWHVEAMLRDRGPVD
jgi:hypothetical protein